LNIRKGVEVRLFKNFDTGETWTLEEVKDSYKAFRYEMRNDHSTFEGYLENLLNMGRAGQGGLVEVEHARTDAEQ